LQGPKIQVSTQTRAISMGNQSSGHCTNATKHSLKEGVVGMERIAVSKDDEVAELSGKKRRKLCRKEIGLIA
jgi:hypothetical protein